MKKLLLIPFIFLFFSCQEEAPQPINQESGSSLSKAKTYTIPAGQHKSTPWNIKFHDGKKILKFTFRLSSDCYYNLGNNNNADINKIYGLNWSLFSDANSFRIGWSCKDQNYMAQMYGYFHRNGIHSWVYLGEIYFDEWYEFYAEIDRANNQIRIVDYEGGGVTVGYKLQWSF